MKKIVILALLFAYKNTCAQLTPIMYFPNNINFIDPTQVYYRPGATEGWYNNLQKYWYYRYRLVNDFLFISETNEAGSSIPAIKRMQHIAWEEEPTINDSCGSCRVLSWGDATVDLGHYIQMLATEEELLRECAHPISRSQYELKHALDAFDRLDDNAEQYCHEMENSLGTNNAYPGTLGPTSISYSDRHNGFFIRDDVPTLTILDEASIGNKLKHFNRIGLKRTWTYPGPASVEYFDRVSWAEGAFTSSFAERYTSFPSYSSSSSPRGNRWHGTIGSHTVTSHWPYTSGAPRYPAQESHDQLIDLNLGMALVSHYSTDAIIRNQAADALYRTVKYPFNVWLPQIHDPLTGKCVYGIVPQTYPSSCDKAGANYFGIAMGGAQTSRIYADPIASTNSLPLIWQASSGISALLWHYVQYSHRIMPEMGCDDPDENENRDLTYAGYYSCLTNSWTTLGINTTWRNLKKICNKDGWGRPSLPLVYELIYNPPENYRYMDYIVALDAAPPCGPHDFSSYEYPAGSGNRPFNNEIMANTVKKHWTGGDWLSNPQHRWLPECKDPEDHTKRSVTFNGLDYMVLFNLFSLKQGSSYLKNLNNPFWDDDYRINYPDNFTIGSNTIPLYLNFLEYSALKGTYSTYSNVSIRGAKQIDCKEGFNSFPDCNGCFTDIYIKDFGCDEHFTFAWIPQSSVELLPPTVEEVNPWGASRMPPPDSSLMLADSLITDSMEVAYIDSLVGAIIDSGNEDAINLLRRWGVNVDSIMLAEKGKGNSQSTLGDNFISLFIDVFPNPATDMAYIKYKLVDKSTVDIKINNSIGIDYSYAIEPYIRDQEPDDYKIGINTNKLPKGLYVLTMKIGGIIHSKKLSVL
ncbi:MAG: T9SS type A sorting domain-containing protein [Taibaiella sp.]|nr:T9SS type A sorting domain-containing protein [Taibaiella sp.]